MKQRYVPELDGLRAIAVLLVITVHMHTREWDWANGALGVVIFFVLSGFLITGLALKEESETGRVDLGAFYIRRVFRIFPLYYVVLATYCVLIFHTAAGVPKRDVMWRVLPYYLAYLQEIPFFRGWAAPFFQSWSLGIEEKFYLVWPVIAFVLLRALPSRREIRAGVAAVLLVATMLSPSVVQPYSCILAGCLLALICPVIRVENDVRARAAVYLSACALLVTHVFLLGGHAFGWRVTFYSAVVAIFVRALLGSRTFLNDFLSSRPLTFVGRISYGIYLVHTLCLNVALRVVSNTAAVFILTCVLCVVAAAAMHYTVERPFIRFGRQLSAKIKRADGLEPAELEPLRP